MPQPSSQTMPQRRVTDLAQLLDTIRPEMLRTFPEEADAVGAVSVGAIAYRAVLDHYGTAKHAAYVLKGHPKRATLLKREIDACNFGCLSKDPDVLRAVIEAIRKVYIDTDPVALIRLELSRVRSLLNAALNEIERNLESVIARGLSCR